jgi:hypothetical protein
MRAYVLFYCSFMFYRRLLLDAAQAKPVKRRVALTEYSCPEPQGQSFERFPPALDLSPKPKPALHTMSGLQASLLNCDCCCSAAVLLLLLLLGLACHVVRLGRAT